MARVSHRFFLFCVCSHAPDLATRHHEIHQVLLVFALKSERYDMKQIREILDTCVSERVLVKIIFSSPRKKSLPYKKVTLRPMLLRGQKAFQAEFHYEKKVLHENMEESMVLDACVDFILRDFKQVNIFTEEEDIQILAPKLDKPRITRKSGTQKQKSLSHNQAKNYIVPEGTPCDFLIRLGVMDAKGKVFQKHYAKFRQINRFLEILQDVLPYLPKDKTLRIIDFGCGKAYLTFALYHYLKIMLGREVEIIGLDLKEDVITFCGKVAADLDYQSLTFLRGDIADFTSDHADLVVTLHACDTATDYALINAVKWNTKVILSVPCCQHELFSQITNDLHQPMYKHGILKDRFTELLTDGLRGLKLEARGYDVAMIEFTSLEHTSKNIMIKAVKAREASPRAQKEYQNLKDFYQVKPTIDEL
jgi:SAM-dependent methyltransferase